MASNNVVCDNVGPDCPISGSFFGYAPSLPPNAVLLALFSVAIIAHTAQGVYYRTWGTFIAFFFGCLSDIIGILQNSMLIGKI